MQVDTLLTRNIANTDPCRRNIEKNTVLELFGIQSRRVLFLSSNPEFYPQCLWLKFFSNMDAYSSPRRTFKSTQEQENRDGAETKETELDVLQRQWKEQKIEKAEGDRHSAEMPEEKEKTTAICATTFSSEVYNWKYFIPH